MLVFLIPVIIFATMSKDSLTLTLYGVPKGFKKALKELSTEAGFEGKLAPFVLNEYVKKIERRAKKIKA